MTTTVVLPVVSVVCIAAGALCLLRGRIGHGGLLRALTAGIGLLVAGTVTVALAGAADAAAPTATSPTGSRASHSTQPPAAPKLSTCQAGDTEAGCHNHNPANNPNAQPKNKKNTQPPTTPKLSTCQAGDTEAGCHNHNPANNPNAQPKNKKNTQPPT